MKIEALAKSQADLRRQVSSGEHKPPKDAEGYKFEISEEQKPTADVIMPEGLDDDPMVANFRDTAHELGLSQDQAQKLMSWYVGQAEQFLPEPLNVEAEMKKLGPRANDIMQHMVNLGDKLENVGLLTDELKEEFYLMAGTANGIKVFDAIFQHYGEHRMLDVINRNMHDGETGDSLKREQADMIAKGEKEGWDESRMQREWEKHMEKRNRVYGG